MCSSGCNMTITKEQFNYLKSIAFKRCVQSSKFVGSDAGLTAAVKLAADDYTFHFNRNLKDDKINKTLGFFDQCIVTRLYSKDYEDPEHPNPFLEDEYLLMAAHKSAARRPLAIVPDQPAETPEIAKKSCQEFFEHLQKLFKDK